MYLLDYSEIKKGEREFKIATLFDPTARRQKVFTKFLNEGVVVPQSKLVTQEDFEDMQEVDVVADLSGNIVSIK